MAVTTKFQPLKHPAKIQFPIRSSLFLSFVGWRLSAVPWRSSGRSLVGYWVFKWVQPCLSLIGTLPTPPSRRQFSPAVRRQKTASGWNCLTFPYRVSRECPSCIRTCRSPWVPDSRAPASEKFSCCNAFHGLNYRFYRHHWDTLYQKMNMIIIRTNLCKMYFKPAFNIFTHFYQTLFNLFRQNTSTIFYRTNQMIQQQVLIMALMNMFAHNTNVIQNTNTTPQQADGELYD